MIDDLPIRLDIQRSRIIFIQRSVSRRSTSTTWIPTRIFAEGNGLWTAGAATAEIVIGRSSRSRDSTWHSARACPIPSRLDFSGAKQTAFGAAGIGYADHDAAAAELCDRTGWAQELRLHPAVTRRPPDTCRRSTSPRRIHATLACS
jgi:hypothetical protein